MGLFRKTMSLSTMGVVNWRNDSERQAAAERSKSKAYRDRTQTLLEQAQADRDAALRIANQQAQAAAPVSAGPPPGWYDDPDGDAGKRWWDGSAWTEHRNS
ncbi:DUF2510 domain-containing protein [Nocardioides sp. L-11A]|uniref:DUF2510 domain-containing protein n=1 Tax=Nocardioides sp. L-11A TaxID=3043848 RepID=UPI00249C8A6C|nr:DUF2510 domain-containing protein [Nocardioides sp. L-11A]